MNEEKRRFKIGELRRRKGLTQKEVAEIFGVSLTTYNKWENYFGELPVRKAKELVCFLSDNKLTLDDVDF